MKKSMKMALTLALAVILCMSVCITAFAHSLTIESLGGTYVSFQYSDGTPCKGAKIIVKNAAGDTIGSSKTTSKGIYNYAEFEGTAAKIVMNDGEGHVGEYEVPAETPAVTDRTPVEENAAPTAPAETTVSAPETETTVEETTVVEETAPTAPAPTAEPEATSAASSGMSTGTIVAVVVVVVALVAVAVLAAKRSKKK